MLAVLHLLPAPASPSAKGAIYDFIRNQLQLSTFWAETGQVLLSIINLAYYQGLMAGMREAIAAKRFAEFQAATQAQWERGDIATL